MPPNTVKVDRTTKWGNPFLPNKRHSKAYCAQLFENLAGGWICVSIDKPSPDEQRAYLKMALENIHELRGKNLACWCPLDAPCHGDVLLRAAAKRRRPQKTKSADLPTGKSRSNFAEI